MHMKNVAGFHSFDFCFLLTACSLFRNGLGIRFAQNDACVTLWEAYERNWGKSDRC